MEERDRIRASKFLSLVLRHRPELIGIELGAGGWVKIEILLAGCAKRGRALTRSQLDEIVRLCPKQRFAVSSDGMEIRANQGHSVHIELGYESAQPPAQLYHGTSERRLDSIRREGLRRMRRHHVHLSEDAGTAERVGQRHGKAVVLTVLAERMLAAGHEFFVSTNGVWLTEHVPTEFLQIGDEDSRSKRLVE